MSHDSKQSGSFRGLSQGELNELQICEKTLLAFPKNEKTPFSELETAYQMLNRISEIKNLDPMLLTDIKDATENVWDAIYAYNHGGHNSSNFKARINDALLFIQKALTHNKVTV